MINYLDEAVKQKEPDKFNFLDEAVAPAPVAQAPVQPVDPVQEAVRRAKNIPQDTMKQSEGNLIKLGSGFNRFGQGAKQSFLTLMESIGELPEGVTEQYTKASISEREEFEEAFKNEYGESFGFAVNQLAGEIAPYFAVPGGQGGAFARVAAGTATGAVGGFLQFAEDIKDKWRNASFGAAFGAALSTAFEAVPALKNFATKQLSKELESKAAQAGVELSKNTGIPFTSSQLAMTPKAQMFVKLARQYTKGETMARDVFVEQQIRALQYFRGVTKRLAGKTNYGAQIQKTFKTHLDDLTAARQNAARQNFAAAQEVARLSETGPNIIGLKGFKGKLDDLIEENTRRTASDAQLAIAKKFQALKERIPDDISPTEMQDLLHTWGKASKGTGRVFTDLEKLDEKAPAKALFRALNDDLDDAIEKGGAGAAELKFARDRYEEMSGAIRILRDSALGPLFNGKVPPSASAIAKKFDNMGAEDIRGVLTILKQVDPGLQKQTQRFFVEQAIKDAKKRGSADAFGFIPARLTKLLADEEKFKAVFNDAESRKMVTDGIKAIRRIMVDNDLTSGMNVSRLKEFAGILASRDKTFVARFGAEMFTPRVLAKAVITDDGVKALADIARHSRALKDRNLTQLALGAPAKYKPGDVPLQWVAGKTGKGGGMKISTNALIAALTKLNSIIMTDEGDE